MSGQRASFISQTFNGRAEWFEDGSYFKLLTAAAACQVELWLQGRQQLLIASAKAGFYATVDFDRVVITNSGAQLTEFIAAPDKSGSDAITGQMAITSPLDADNADGGAPLGANGLLAVASRLKAYNGATFDRLRSVTAGGNPGALVVAPRKQGGPGFVGSTDGSAPGAGLYRYVQLWNPGPLTLYVDSLEVRGSVNNEVQIRYYNNSLPNPVGVSGNKTLGGAAPTALLKTDAQAAVPGTIIGGIWDDPAGGPRRIIYEEPIVVPANLGLLLVLNSANSSFQVEWEWREV